MLLCTYNLLLILFNVNSILGGAFFKMDYHVLRERFYM